MAIPEKTAEYFFPKYEGIESLTYRESALSPPKENEALVKIHAVSLNYRDYVAACGTYYGQKESDLVPCCDMGAEVIAVGSNVSKWKKGDRVTSSFSIKHLFGEPPEDFMETTLGGPIDGVLTQYKNLPADALVRIPDYLSYEEASTLTCAAVTAWNALLGPIPLKGGDVVLVQGTGGVSIFGLQIAVALGATVICTSSSDEKLQFAKKLGAHHLINYKTHPNWDEEALKLTGGRGVDHILEVGGDGSLPKSINASRLGGSIHGIGFLAPPEGAAQNLALKLLSRGIIYRGILVGTRTQFEDMNRLFEARQIRPVIDKVFPFDQVKEAYKHLVSQKHIGKVVIKVSA